MHNKIEGYRIKENKLNIAVKLAVLIVQKLGVLGKQTPSEVTIILRNKAWQNTANNNLDNRSFELAKMRCDNKRYVKG